MEEDRPRPRGEPPPLSSVRGPLAAVSATSSVRDPSAPPSQLVMSARVPEIGHAGESARERAKASLARAQALNPSLNAFITLTPEVAMADSARADEARDRGRRLPLDGLTLAVKDNLDVAGIPTTVASRFFQANAATRDAHVVRRLRRAGAVVVGKTNLHEFAFGALTANPPPYGICHNPWDLSRTPGGSSGGSAVALAADITDGALGSDTGGSVRIPAGLCGVTGLRPTFGRVSTDGCFPLSWSLDTVGPMARSAALVARLFKVTDGAGTRDDRAPRRIPTRRSASIAGLRFGLAGGFFAEADAVVLAAVRDVATVMIDLGAKLLDVNIPGAEAAFVDAGTIIRADAIALHGERYATEPERFGAEIRERLRRASAVTGQELAGAVQRAYEWRLALRRVFTAVDALLLPTTSTTAPVFGGDAIATTSMLVRMTYPWSLAHVPALSMPCGFSADGLPIGCQLVAAPWSDELLLNVATAYQAVTTWHERRPALEPMTPRARLGLM
jgi:aspartyl-tRNA(Asn)/glutamyl-tRNA(Gln) amidotransferase subunit A